MSQKEITLYDVVNKLVKASLYRSEELSLSQHTCIGCKSVRLGEGGK